MEIGAVSEVLNVHEESPLMDTRSSDVSTVIDPRSIADLPLGNRRTLNVIGATGAVVFVSYGNTPANAKPNFSLAGGRTQSQMFWIDGGYGAEHAPGRRRRSISIRRSRRWKRSRFSSNNYSAEYGGVGGRRDHRDDQERAATSSTAAPYDICATTYGCARLLRALSRTAPR